MCLAVILVEQMLLMIRKIARDVVLGGNDEDG